MDALELCVKEIHAVAVDVKAYPVSEEDFKDALRYVIMKYYKSRSIEILCGLDEYGMMLDDVKIGGTD
jgi:hypothetical protein